MCVLLLESSERTCVNTCTTHTYASGDGIVGRANVPVYVCGSLVPRPFRAVQYI